MFIAGVTVNLPPPKKFGPPGPNLLGNMPPGQISQEIWPPLRKFGPLRMYFTFSIYLDINNVNAGKVYLIPYVQYMSYNKTY